MVHSRGLARHSGARARPVGGYAMPRHGWTHDIRRHDERHLGSRQTRYPPPARRTVWRAGGGASRRERVGQAYGRRGRTPEGDAARFRSGRSRQRAVAANRGRRAYGERFRRRAAKTRTGAPADTRRRLLARARTRAPFAARPRLATRAAAASRTTRFHPAAHPAGAARLLLAHVSQHHESQHGL